MAPERFGPPAYSASRNICDQQTGWQPFCITLLPLPLAGQTTCARQASLAAQQWRTTQPAARLVNRCERQSWIRRALLCGPTAATMPSLPATWLRSHNNTTAARMEAARTLESRSRTVCRWRCWRQCRRCRPRPRHCCQQCGQWERCTRRVGGPLLGFEQHGRPTPCNQSENRSVPRLSMPALHWKLSLHP